MTAPHVSVGNGEPAPWTNLPLTCPTCGEGPLPLHRSVPSLLSFISHCGQSWMRGPFPVYEQDPS